MQLHRGADGRGSDALSVLMLVLPVPFRSSTSQRDAAGAFRPDPHHVVAYRVHRRHQDDGRPAVAVGGHVCPEALSLQHRGKRNSAPHQAIADLPGPYGGRARPKALALRAGWRGGQGVIHHNQDRHGSRLSRAMQHAMQQTATRLSRQGMEVGGGSSVVQAHQAHERSVAPAAPTAAATPPTATTTTAAIV